MREIREIKGFGGSETYYDVKRSALDQPNKENLEVLNDLKSFRKKSFKLWFLSLLAFVIAITIVGVFTNFNNPT